MNIGVGVSRERNSTAAAEEAARMARFSLKNKADLALLFTSTDLASATLLDTLSRSLGEIPLIGASAAGIFSPQGIFHHAVALVLIELSEQMYCKISGVTEVKVRSRSAGEETGEKLLAGFPGSSRAFCLAFSDAFAENPLFVEGLRSYLGRYFPILGISASGGQFLKSRVFYNHRIFSDSCAAMLWGGKLAFGVGLKHGFKPLGKPHFVTRAEGNTVMTIDNEPAAALYQNYLGWNLNRLQKELKEISALYPLGIQTTGDEYILRNPLSINEAGHLEFQAQIAPASTVRLMIGTKETCLAAAQEAATEAKKALESNPLAKIKSGSQDFEKLALVFSSISRQRFLKREAWKELGMVQTYLGKELPVIGIYTNMEVAPSRQPSAQDKISCHNQSITVLLLGG